MNVLILAELQFLTQVFAGCTVRRGFLEAGHAFACRWVGRRGIAETIQGREPWVAGASNFPQPMFQKGFGEGEAFKWSTRHKPLSAKGRVIWVVAAEEGSGPGVLLVAEPVAWNGCLGARELFLLGPKIFTVRFYGLDTSGFSRRAVEGKTL